MGDISLVGSLGGKKRQEYCTRWRKLLSRALFLHLQYADSPSERGGGGLRTWNYHLTADPRCGCFWKIPTAPDRFYFAIRSFPILTSCISFHFAYFTRMRWRSFSGDLDFPSFSGDHSTGRQGEGSSTYSDWGCLSLAGSCSPTSLAFPSLQSAPHAQMELLPEGTKGGYFGQENNRHTMRPRVVTGGGGGGGSRCWRLRGVNEDFSGARTRTILLCHMGS